MIRLQEDDTLIWKIILINTWPFQIIKKEKRITYHYEDWFKKKNRLIQQEKVIKKK